MENAQKYIETFENEDTFQNLSDIAEAVLRRNLSTKFIYYKFRT